MEVKKNNNYFELIFDEEKFILDPPTLNQEVSVILSDISKNINKDKIFNSPGEYNVNDVYFWGFSNKNYFVYLFESKEGTFLYSREILTEETIKKIKSLRKNVDALLFVDFFNKDFYSYFKPKIILTNKDINFEKFKKEKGDKIKANLKKVENLLFVFK